jgi:DNA helicase-2/ATP-dependent DNA helicase PcrA
VEVIPEFLNDLNESQRKAVEYIDGPSLVIAGAGSGKTRVLTYKIAYLLTQGMKPWEIMALTFTNKAAKEMKERIAKLVGDEARYLRMGTFHSVFAQILRMEAERIGYKPSYTIYDESDSRSLCKAIIKEMQLDDKVYKAAEVHNRISSAKNALIGPQQYVQKASLVERDEATKMPKVGLIYEVYCQRCRASNAMDFDDLLYYTYLLFKKNEDVRLKYANAFQFFLVDEYQDTNYAQQQIIQQLASEHKHVCVVGDDA